MTDLSTNLKYQLFSRAVQLATTRANGFENGEDVVARFIYAANTVNAKAFNHSDVLDEFYRKRFVSPDNRLQVAVMDFVADIIGIYRTSLLLSGIEDYDLPMILAESIGRSGVYNEMSCPTSFEFEKQFADMDTIHKALVANDWLTALVAIRFCCPELLYDQPTGKG